MKKEESFEERKLPKFSKKMYNIQKKHRKKNEI